MTDPKQLRELAVEVGRTSGTHPLAGLVVATLLAAADKIERGEQLAEAAWGILGFLDARRDVAEADGIPDDNLERVRNDLAAALSTYRNTGE